MSEPANKLPDALTQNPRLDDWIRIDAADTITLRTGKVELGQGIHTALALIAAEELDVALERVRVEGGDSARKPFEFPTVGSMTMETTGAAVRLAAAEARHQLLLRASARLGVPPASLRVRDGEIESRQGDRRIDYWQLMAGASFDCVVSGEALPKPSSEHRLIGQPAQRIDIAALVFGERRFVNDLVRPNMLHGRSLRVPCPAARVLELELEPVRNMPGVVHVLRDGDFVGVLAEREEHAIAAIERLRELVRLDEPECLPDADTLHAHMPEHVFGSFPLQEAMPVAAPVPALVVPEAAAHTLHATYTRPYLMHGSIGPSASLAYYDRERERYEVYCASQGVHLLAVAIAQVLGVKPDRVHAIHVPGSGCYGHNGSDDTALEAALLARSVPGRHVLLKWSRRDEHTSEPYGPAQRVDVTASIDAGGKIIAYSHDTYSATHIGRAFPMGRASALLAAQQLEQPFDKPAPRPMLMPQGGVHRNAWPYYRIPAPRVIKHLLRSNALRTSSLRSLGAYTNVFAMESMMDELAHAAGVEPLAFRLAHLDDPRARQVIEAGAERAGFVRPKPAGDEDKPRGRGMAFSRYENYKCMTAVFIEVEVDLASFEIRVPRAVIAADAGQVIDPDGLRNQLEGGLVQSLSWTLREAVTFDRTRITSLDWESYPILRVDEAPEIEVVVLDRPDERPLGAGEASIGPTPAALANAAFDACGARLRATPFTPQRLRAALYG
jgi:CO/xanthine dehydrogenase Mo-binding subunit